MRACVVDISRCQSDCFSVYASVCLCVCVRVSVCQYVLLVTTVRTAFINVNVTHSSAVIQSVVSAGALLRLQETTVNSVRRLTTSRYCYRRNISQSTQL